MKKYSPSSDHIPRSNPVLTLLVHCPRVHGFSLFGKLDCWIAGLPDFTVYQNYEKTVPSCRLKQGFLSQVWCIGVSIRPIRPYPNPIRVDYYLSKGIIFHILQTSAFHSVTSAHRNFFIVKTDEPSSLFTPSLFYVSNLVFLHLCFRSFM